MGKLTEQEALELDGEKLRQLTDEDHGPWDYDYQDDCPSCGGEGVIYMCLTEYACIDPEYGCGMCEQRCDLCSPPATRAALERDT